MAFPIWADEIETHRFARNGSYQPAGWPDLPPKLLVVAEKPLRLHLPGLPVDRQFAVEIHRITSARKILLQAPEAQATAEGWKWTWTPPAASGPAHYEIRFKGEPNCIVLIETRDAAWLKATLEMLRNQADWEVQGLSAEERAALTAHGLQLGRASARGRQTIASLKSLPRKGTAARRRVVWDEQDPGLVVWRPGPASGDLEVRAPRWWISPAALATDQGLIRFLDLFSESSHKP